MAAKKSSLIDYIITDSAIKNGQDCTFVSVKLKVKKRSKSHTFNLQLEITQHLQTIEKKFSAVKTGVRR